jgi:hypothetical protein
LFHIQDQIENLQQKTRLNRKQLALLEKLKEDEKVYRHRVEIAAELQTDSQKEKADPPAKAAQMAFGALIACVSVLTFLSMVLSLLDKSIHSCGYSCRYLLQVISYFTPIDLILLSSLNVTFLTKVSNCTWSILLSSCRILILHKLLYHIGQGLWIYGSQAISNRERAHLIRFTCHINSHFNCIKFCVAIDDDITSPAIPIIRQPSLVQQHNSWRPRL